MPAKDYQPQNRFGKMIRTLNFSRRDLTMFLGLLQMSLRDRFLGSALGLFWFILSPLFLMGIFCFVFTFVFPGRLPGKTGPLPFVIWLICGYGPWLAMSDGLSASTSSVVSASSLVKNISFRSEFLPIIATLISLAPMFVAFAIVIVLEILNGVGLNFTWVALPLIIFFQVAIISGIGMFLGALNVFVRDVALVLPNILTLVLFASPIFYAISVYPAPIRPFVGFSPFYVLTECYRLPIIDGRWPQLWMLIYLAVVSAICLSGGLMWFSRLKPFFDTRL